MCTVLVLRLFYFFLIFPTVVLLRYSQSYFFLYCLLFHKGLLDSLRRPQELKLFFMDFRPYFSLVTKLNFVWHKIEMSYEPFRSGYRHFCVDVVETLRVLYLGDNDFETFPAGLGKLKNLQIVSLFILYNHKCIHFLFSLENKNFHSVFL